MFGSHWKGRVLSTLIGAKVAIESVKGFLENDRAPNPKDWDAIREIKIRECNEALADLFKVIKIDEEIRGIFEREFGK